MTLLNLDHYINMYIHKLKLNKSIKGVNNVTHFINHSKKSKSIYLSLYLLIGNNNYKKTLRISDHYLNNLNTKSDKFKGILVGSNKNISSEKLRKLENYIFHQIKKLLKDAPMHAIYTFDANLN